MSRPMIFIATPCYGGQIHQFYMQSVIQLMQHVRGSMFDTTLALLGNDSLITRSRNTLVSAFLDMPQATHLMFIDADISFEPVQVERMLKLGEDVVAGIYPLKVLDWQNALPLPGRAIIHEEMALRYCGEACRGEEAERRGDFISGSYAGTGFMLISRVALERMIAAYPELRYGGTHVYPPTQSNRPRYALFDCMIDPESGTYLSEDYAFCRRWRQIGGKIWLDTKGRLTHSGMHDFHGNPAPRFATSTMP